MPSRLTGQNIGLYLRGHCKKFFFQIFFHSHDWHHTLNYKHAHLRSIHIFFCIYDKLMFWPSSHFFKNWPKLDQMAPPECGHFFDHLQMTSTLAHMIYCTNKGGFQRFYIFLNFLLIYNALQTDWSKHRSIPQGGIVKNSFSKFSFIAMIGTCGSPCSRKFVWFGGGWKITFFSKTGLS